MHAVTRDMRGDSAQSVQNVWNTKRWRQGHRDNVRNEYDARHARVTWFASVHLWFFHLLLPSAGRPSGRLPRAPRGLHLAATGLAVAGAVLGAAVVVGAAAVAEAAVVAGAAAGSIAAVVAGCDPVPTPPSYQVLPTPLPGTAAATRTAGRTAAHTAHTVARTAAVGTALGTAQDIAAAAAAGAWPVTWNAY